MDAVEWWNDAGWPSALLRLLAGLSPWLWLAAVAWRWRRLPPRGAWILLALGILVGLAGWWRQALYFNPLVLHWLGARDPHAYLQGQPLWGWLRLLGANFCAVGLFLLSRTGRKSLAGDRSGG